MDFLPFINNSTLTKTSAFQTADAMPQEKDQPDASLPPLSPYTHANAKLQDKATSTTKLPWPRPLAPSPSPEDLANFTRNNYYWPPHHPSNTFSSTSKTPATTIANPLPKAAVAQYYPFGFPDVWEDSPEEKEMKRRREEDARRREVERTGRTDLRAVISPAARDGTRVEGFLERIVEVEMPGVSRASSVKEKGKELGPGERGG